MKHWGLTALAVGFAALGAKAQPKQMTSAEELLIPGDSATNALVDSMIAAKCRITQLQYDSNAVRLLIYPENTDHISFLKFRDYDGNDTLGRDEIEYAEFSNGYAAVIAERITDTSELTTRTLFRSTQGNPPLLKRKTAYDQNPPPKDDAHGTLRWIINRNLRKPS